MERRNIPWDLIEEILSRVLTKSVARFRSTSKGWNDLLKSRSFAKKHLANAPKNESMSIMLTDSRVCLLKINLHGFHDNVAPSVKLVYQFYLKDPLSDSSSQVDIRHVFHCDGLLLCITEDKRLVVWNPCSGQTKWIPPRDSHKITNNIYALGYDNKASSKQYKILRMVVNPQKLTENEVFDFTSKSWRVLGVTTDWCFESPHGGGMSMKGNTYWVVTDPTRRGESHLLCFDFSSERFHNWALARYFPGDFATLSAFREDQLFMLAIDASSRAYLHVWVTTISGSVMSWSKFLSFKANLVEDCWLSFLADEQNQAVLCCSPNHSKFLQIVGGNKLIQVDPRDGDSTIIPPPPLVLSYVPSLAQIAS